VGAFAAVVVFPISAKRLFLVANLTIIANDGIKRGYKFLAATCKNKKFLLYFAIV